MAKIVLHLENLDEIDTKQLLRHLAEEIAEDARRLAPVGKTGKLRESIHVGEVYFNSATVIADPRNPDPDTKPADKPYAAHVERGTSDTPRMPFLAPATYRYRS